MITVVCYLPLSNLIQPLITWYNPFWHTSQIQIINVHPYYLWISCIFLSDKYFVLWPWFCSLLAVWNMYMLHNYFTVFIYRNHTFTSYKFVFLLWCLSCSSVKLGYGLSLDRGPSLLHRTRRGKNMNHGGSVSRKSAAWLLLRAAWCSLQTPGKTIFLMFQSQIGGWSVIMPDHDTAAPLSSIIILLFLLTADCGSARPSAAASDQSII